MAAALQALAPMMVRFRYDQPRQGVRQMSDIQDQGLFPVPAVPVRFCAGAMGGYGEWDSLSKGEAVLSLVVPAEMLSGQSIDSLNSQEYRERLAALLVQPDPVR